METTRKPKLTAAQAKASAAFNSHARKVQARVSSAPFKVTDSAGCTRGFATQAEADAWRAKIS